MRDGKVTYRADPNPPTRWHFLEFDVDENQCYGNVPWSASIHMPRWASRLTPEIADLRVERLCDITRKDAADEGVCLPLDKPLPAWCQ